MYTSLKNDSLDINDLLDTTLHEASGYLAAIAARPPATDRVAKKMLDLPENGLAAAGSLKLFTERYGSTMAASNGPRFWGFVTGGTTPAALMGDWLASTYDVNLSDAANSSAPDIELEAIHMLRQLFGLPETFSGIFVTGATMSNFAGLAIAREWAGLEYGKSISQAGLYAVPPVRVLSGAAHSSAFKALAMLGMGRGNLRTVAGLPGDREAVEVSALKQALKELQGEPCIVIANAGTVNTVDFDDIEAIAALKTEFNFWLHVDAAFGGFAACSPKFRHLLDGLARADSVTIDAHKWLNVPYDSGMLFTCHRDLQIAVFRNSAAYLGEIVEPVGFVHLTPENSRRMRALPAWFTLTAYGRAGYQEIVERNCFLAHQFGERIRASAEFELLAPVRLNVVCFTLRGVVDAGGTAAFLARLRDDGRVFMTPTTYNGRPAIRAAISNWRTTEGDLDIAWQAMRECMQQG